LKKNIIEKANRLVKEFEKASSSQLEDIFNGVKKNQKKISDDVEKATKIVGPGVITGFSDDDPSGIGTYSVTGAKYGLGLNWLVPLQIPLMIAIQEICARIGISTGHGLAGNIKKFYSKKILIPVVALLVLTNIFNIGVDISAMSASLKLVIGGNLVFWAILITLVIILLEVFISYRVYANFLKWLTIFLLTYLLTVFYLPQNWLEIGRSLFTFNWRFTSDYIATIVAILGTTISPYLFFWQTSEEVEENIKDKTISEKFINPKRISRMRWDTVLGMMFSQIIALSIVITCATVLNKNGITNIASAQDAASALKPLVGDMAGLFFAIGIVGAGLLGIPVLAGSAAYALSEAFGWKEGLFHKFKEASGFYGIIIFSILCGLGINFIGISPIRGLFYSAVLNGIVAVPLIAIIMKISNSSQIMGNQKNKIWSNLFGWLTFAIMLVAVVAMFIYL